MKTQREQKPFSGFPSGRARMVPIPEVFFTELLPQIEHPGELRVTLACLYHLARRSGPLRYVRRSELETDPALTNALSAAEIRRCFSRKKSSGRNIVASVCMSAGSRSTAPRTASSTSRL